MFTPLALDIATVTGWAVHLPGEDRPFFGAFRLPGEAREVGRPCSALERFLKEKHAIYNFTDIVFEDQFIPTQVNSSTARRLLGLAAVTEKFAFEHRLRCYSIELSKWRKHFIGRGGGFKRHPKGHPAAGKYMPGENPKELALRKCEEFGWYTDIADAAEACGVLDYYMHMLMGAADGYRIPWRDRGLFGGALEG